MSRFNFTCDYPAICSLCKSKVQLWRKNVALWKWELLNMLRACAIKQVLAFYVKIHLMLSECIFFIHYFIYVFIRWTQVELSWAKCTFGIKIYCHLLFYAIYDVEFSLDAQQWTAEKFTVALPLSFCLFLTSFATVNACNHHPIFLLEF